MGILIIKAIGLLLLPLVVFLGGGYLMQKLSDPGQLRDKVQKEKDLKGLGLRLEGYKLEAIKEYWGALKLEHGALDAERRMLEIDLVFPFVYGAGFAVALLLAWAALGRPFHPVWIVTPLFVEVVADWIENLIQLRQVRLFSGSEGILQPGWIQIASVATSVKVALFCVSYILVVGMVVWMIYRNWPRSLAR
jgi:hypothetical protein